MKTFAVPFRY